MELMQTLVALIAVGISIFSLVMARNHNKKILDLEQGKMDLEEKVLSLENKKMFLEFGTLETIAMEKQNLRKDHEERKSAILRKWTDEQSREAEKLASQGISYSSHAEKMKKRVADGKKREMESEIRDFKLGMKKLEEKEKLIKQKSR